MVDGVYKPLDNCPFVYNPLQEDADEDGVGDVCDNCMYKNPLQEDADLDGVGDGGIGEDNLYHACDNCKLTFNPEQANLDGDNYGDVCDNCKSLSNNPEVPGDPHLIVRLQNKQMHGYLIMCNKMGVVKKIIFLYCNHMSKLMQTIGNNFLFLA